MAQYAGFTRRNRLATDERHPDRVAVHRDVERLPERRLAATSARRRHLAHA
jgi:hypothetical protein